MFVAAGCSSSSSDNKAVDAAARDSEAIDDEGVEPDSAADAVTEEASSDGEVLPDTSPDIVENAPPSLASPAATPPRVRSGETVLLTVEAADSDGTIAAVTADLTNLLGAASAAMLDDGQNGDAAANDGIYSLETTVPATSDPVDLVVLVTAEDNQGATVAIDISVAVQPPRSWRPLRPTGRTEGEAIWDAANGRVIMIGRSNYFYSFSGELLYAALDDEVWSWSATDGWTMIPTTGDPPGVQWQAVVYDPKGQRLISFGGSYGSLGYDNTVYALSLTPGSEGWSMLSPTGTPPTPRDGVAAVYDPQAHRVVYYGGYTEDDVFSDELWSLSLDQGSEAWTQLSPSGTAPPAAWEPAMAYDPVNHRAMMFGGWGEADILDGLYSLDLTAGAEAWALLAASGPSGRFQSAMVYDDDNARVLLFGGAASEAVLSSDGAWALSTTLGAETWTPISTTDDPTPRYGIANTFVPGTGLWLFGGFTGKPSEANSGDLWLLDATVGSESWSGERCPKQRFAPSVAYDAAADRMLLYSGSHARDGWGPLAAGDLWALDLQPDVPSWSPLEVSGDAPNPRFGNSAPFDSQRRVWAIGAGFYSDMGYTDSWLLSVASPMAWTEVAALPSSEGEVAIYDEANDRFVYDGGGMFPPEKRTRLYHPATQTNETLSPSGTPPTFSTWHAAVYDASNQRMVIVGGALGSPVEVWELGLVAGQEAWTQLSAGGTPPSSSGTRVVVSGTNALYFVDGKLWRLGLASGAEAWSEMTVAGTAPATRERPGVIFDPKHNRLLLFGGVTSMPYTAHNSDLWEISYFED